MSHDRKSCRSLFSPNRGVRDDYVLGEEIARGGTGYILEAEDTKLKRTVAGKLMVFESGTDDGIQRRFLRAGAAGASKYRADSRHRVGGWGATFL